MKDIVLFDMDGTLSEPRQSIESPICNTLSKLLEKAEVGIVTGSDVNYLFEQSKKLLELISRQHANANKLVLMPCNGTKLYRWRESCSLILEKETNIKHQIGESNFRQLMCSILSLQSSLARQYYIPLTGHFVQYRDSMVNWCPIGRNAANEQREYFCALDEEKGIRDRYINFLRRELKSWGLTDLEVALGGSTSFDIYPTGWDKTYALKHFPDHDLIWFVGDKCDENGNDKSLYDFLRTTGTSFKTESPNQTIDIINKKISPFL